MPAFKQDLFIDFMIENKVLGFYQKAITLKSGRASRWYVNWRGPTSDVFLIDQVTDFILAFCADKNLKPDLFYGVPEGGTKLGLLASYKLAKASKHFAKGSHIFSLGRAVAKEHGDPKDRYFIGEPKGKVILLEDVTTTGSSLLQSIDKLQSAGCEIIAALALSNRAQLRNDGSTVAESLQQKGVPYFALSSAQDFLPRAIDALNPSDEVIESIQTEFDEYGEKALKLF
ncbi:MAG: hypothetical protein COV43_02865 [Deltaproteobacteria bacterium CG11_big_fil_rev_8_21_14_0_20_42_23]|nr:MAG: hypothetical protein COV43_02865 [Deltaproteobacteria bacterium CG11_big_fil_rev_8_21_14_0_20_42_23]PJC63727.1 MAG: hypothetical protein CO021_07480 [Deltaproteobacteria bacterium CG_4_9_14_0_2_um_filter_42_21]